jgi:hypothetical protein
MIKPAIRTVAEVYQATEISTLSPKSSLLCTARRGRDDSFNAGHDEKDRLERAFSDWLPSRPNGL